ncbi:hypothetical protein ART_1710 [Arthrobacter sp. PAMC 25486]|uniref:SGNH/GDSL hydrolase family protein n=1 Tax=Arthrobacter sp. PAMC 25486 TaxID=1494608 RepID=UPI000536053D|nr:SGNH/GDSL hydrolase family protein [Arthrobacter sp. PAMC 25486]AIY01309.1 hypothetical protein ART_1710 [Arthrobacter sp. PAMC 25486]
MEARKLALRGGAGLALAISTALLGPVVVPTYPVPRVVAPPAVAVEPAPAAADRNALPDGGRAVDSGSPDEAVSVWDLPAGTIVLNPVSGRREILDPAVARTAVLMGDSQSAGAAGTDGAHTWVAAGLAARGYKVDFVGAPGTGFVAGTTFHANYPDAVESGAVMLPYGNPALVVVQGGGNDAAQGASDAQIMDNAERLLRDLKASYPRSDFLFIGTLSSGAAAGGRRVQVDALLAGIAQRNGIRFISAGDWITRYGLADKMADGVHLNASGHEVLTKVLTAKLGDLKLVAPRP